MNQREPGARGRPLWVVGFVGLAVLVAAGAYALRRGTLQKSVEASSAWVQESFRGENAEPAGPAYVSRDFNYRFQLPGASWHKDDALKVAVKANAFALARANPDAWMALAAKDYKQFIPDAGQLTDEAVRRLGGYFKNLEWDQKGEGELGGRKARRLVFQGKVGDTPASGECFLLGYQGVGYWFTTWTTAEAARQKPQRVADEFQRLRRGFSLGRDRENWRESRRSQSFAGKRAAYEFRGVTGPWKEWPNPTAEDERADLLLLGADPEDAGEIARQSSVLVLLLGKPADWAAATAAARARADAERKKVYAATTAEVIADADGPFDRDQPVGDGPGHVVALHVRDGDGRERFLLLAVARKDESPNLLVIQCECDWRRQARWEPAFLNLLAQFRWKKEAGR